MFLGIQCKANTFGEFSATGIIILDGGPIYADCEYSATPI